MHPELDLIWIVATTKKFNPEEEKDKENLVKIWLNHAPNKQVNEM